MTTHREKLLGHARADLAALPELTDELARLIADRHHDTSGYRGKVTGSPAPLQLPIVHLVGGGIHKPAAWHGEDPRQPRWALTWYDRKRDEKTAHMWLYPTEQAARNAHAQLDPHLKDGARVNPWRARDLYHVAAMLALWVRILWEEMPEIPELSPHTTVRTETAVLLEHWDWIESQEWASELAQDVSTMASQVRAALGIRPEPVYRCAQCGNDAYLQPGGIMACTEVPDHDIVVRNLEQQMRRRPALPTKDICEEFDLEPGTLRQWKMRRKISPSREERGSSSWWFPWDVFCIVNPDIAEAIKLRDEVSDGPQSA